jgi:hypothetical protein
MTGLLTNRQTLQEKIKKTPTHEKNNLNFYGNRTSGTFGVAATLKASPKATPKEPLFANAL